MKKMKKLLAMLLTLAMVMGMTMTAMAATATTITVNGMPTDVDNAEVTYVQVVVPDPTNVTGWDIVDTYFTAFKTAFDVETEEAVINALIELGKVENYKDYASTGTINTSQEFAAALGAIIVPTDSVATKGTNGVWTIDAAEAGLYVINAKATGYSYIPMAAYVAFDKTDNTKLVSASVTVKGSETKIDKSIDDDDDKSVTAGDIVEWTATTEYPYYAANAESKTFWVEDTLTNATFVADSVVVTVAGIGTLKKDVDYTINAYAGTNKYTITFNYNDTYAGKDVTIKYSALVGAGEADVTNTIKSNLDSNGDYEKLDKVQVTITKVSDDTTPVSLSGATFKIYKEVTVETADKITLVNPMVNDAATTETIYVVEFAEGITDENGNVVFVGLDAQETYYIKETVAPAGYSLNESYYKLNPTNDETAEGSDEYAFANFADTTVKDTKLAALPSTGGIGTTIFTIGGCVIMMAAAFLFFASRRRDEA